MAETEGPLLRDIYDSLSPADYRYWDEEVAYYLSENGFIRYCLGAEKALVKVQHNRGQCDEQVVAEVNDACSRVTTREVYEEEARINHDMRALVNRINVKVSENSRPFVHRMATSFDIRDTATAARFRDVTQKVAVPRLTQLEKTLIDITVREAETVQIGRTHGQHAVPITFGFALAEYVSRLGNSIVKLDELSNDLQGKFSGAAGAYNSSSLFFEDPEEFEREMLAEMDLEPGEHSTQIVHPESLVRLSSEYVISSGIMANLADDMRHLQRSEIGEVGEPFALGQVGSSTMGQKRNPINFENAKSLWKVVMPRIVTVYMDQISEHQRDLTNSASSRTYGESVDYVVASAKRLNRIMTKLQVDPVNMQRNLALTGDQVLAEPMYILLAAYGHPDAHETVRKMTLTAAEEQRTLLDVMVSEPNLDQYTEQLTEYQWSILREPSKYIGIAAQKALKVADNWKTRLNL